MAVIAAAWFLALTLLNVSAGGSLRGTIFYAVPVVLAAWHDLRLGFVFAAVGALSAWAGGSIPHPGIEEPVLIEGSWAFFKLSLTVSIKSWHYAYLFIRYMRNDGRKRTV